MTASAPHKPTPAKDPAKGPRYERQTRDAANIHSGKRLLDAARVCDFLSISEDTLARLIDDPDERFPAPVTVVAKGRHWALEDLEKWVARKQQQAARQDKR